MSQDFDSKIWTSELNSRPEVLPPFDRSRRPVRFYDTTLRDGRVPHLFARFWRKREDTQVSPALLWN